MKTVTAALLTLLAVAGSATAETATGATSVEACPLFGSLEGPTAECQALRQTYQAEVASCLDQMRVEADARGGLSSKLNSHISRARFTICDGATRERLGLESY